MFINNLISAQSLVKFNHHGNACMEVLIFLKKEISLKY